MSVRFNADEVFQVAERMEQNAAAYYRAASQAVSVPAQRQLLQELASWEEQHKELFSSMRAQLPSGDKESTVWDPGNEVGLYLKTLADESVFPAGEDPAKTMGKKPGFEKILLTAIGKEKDAVAFYSGMREVIPENLGKSKINDILREEMKHVTILTEQLKKARGSVS